MSNPCEPMDYSLQAPLSMGFSRQEYWSGLPLPSPGDLPDPGIEPGSPALQVSYINQLYKHKLLRIYESRILEPCLLDYIFFLLHMSKDYFFFYFICLKGGEKLMYFQKQDLLVGKFKSNKNSVFSYFLFLSYETRKALQQTGLLLYVSFDYQKKST